MTENYRYYYGFEGEPEYTFCLCAGNNPIEKVYIWDGYFCDIIRTVTPTETGWTSLAECYHMCIYFDNDNRKVIIFLKSLLRCSQKPMKIILMYILNISEV